MEDASALDGTLTGNAARVWLGRRQERTLPEIGTDLASAAEEHGIRHGHRTDHSAGAAHMRFFHVCGTHHHFRALGCTHTEMPQMNPKSGFTGATKPVHEISSFGSHGEFDTFFVANSPGAVR
jgi:hypothetical protein